MSKQIRNERFKHKYLAIQEAFKRKYNNEGKRSSVIWEELEKEFFLSPSRLQEIVRLDLSGITNDQIDK